MRKIANSRKDWTHKLSTAIVLRAILIVVGNVSSAKLVKTRFAKSVYDASWSDFKAQLVYKAMRLGVRYVEVNEAFSSVTCSACLHSDRPEWTEWPGGESMAVFALWHLSQPRYQRCDRTYSAAGMQRRSRESPDFSQGRMSTILEPIVKDEGSQIIIQTRDSSTIEQVTINYMEANAIQHTIQRRIQGMREPVTGVHNNVVLYWYQARGTPASSPIDKGVIESLSPNPVKVLLPSDAIKASILLEDDNPFRMAYLVDVAVETVNGRPIL